MMNIVPDMMTSFFSTVAGVLSLLAVIILVVIGFLTIRKICSSSTMFDSPSEHSKAMSPRFRATSKKSIWISPASPMARVMMFFFG